MATGNSCNYSPTQYDVQVGGASGTLTSVSVGTAGQVLSSGGAGANPSWISDVYLPPNNAGQTISTDVWYKSYLTTISSTYTAGSITLTMNRQYLMCVFLPFAGSYTQITTLVENAVASSNIRFGLYAVNASTGQPGALICDSGTISAATTGAKTGTVSSFSITPGYYFFSIICDSSSGIVMYSNGSSGSRASSGTICINGGSVPVGFVDNYYTSTTFGALANPWSSTGITPFSAITSIVFYIA
jgi:hypothetical protein